MGSEPHSRSLMAAQCKAHAKSTGKQCTRRAINGGVVCPVHGNNARSKAKAAANVAEAKARAVMARRGLPEPVAITSTEAMIWSISAKYAEVLWLRREVQQVGRDDLVFGVTREKTSKAPPEPVDGTEPGPGTGEPPVTFERTFEARANIWWVMLRSAEDQLVKFAKDARSCNVDEAQITLARRQGEMLGAMFGRFLDQLMDALRDALIQAGVTQGEFVRVWKETIDGLFPAAFRALGQSNGGEQ